jgi:hypothetical protein
MRSLTNLDALLKAEFFIDTVSGYGSDFAYSQNFLQHWLISIISRS